MEFNYKLPGNPNFINGLAASYNFNRIAPLIENKNRFAVVSGFGVTGEMHLGSKLLIDQLAYYQKLGGKLFLPIADFDGIVVKGKSQQFIKRHTLNFLRHFKAGGIDLKKCEIYTQLGNRSVTSMALQFLKKISEEDYRGVYGDYSLKEFIALLVTVADMLYPQTIGFNNTLIVVSMDEKKHIDFCYKVISKEGNRFKKPTATFQKPLLGLSGEKMGKSLPEETIYLLDSPEKARKKFWERALIDKIHPENCRVFNLYQLFFLKSIQDIKKIKSNCNKRENVCNICKRECANILKNYLENYQKEYNNTRVLINGYAKIFPTSK